MKKSLPHGDRDRAGPQNHCMVVEGDQISAVSWMGQHKTVSHLNTAGETR